MESSRHPSEAGVIISSIFMDGKMRPKEAETLAQGHAASKSPNLRLGPRPVDEGKGSLIPVKYGTSSLIFFFFFWYFVARTRRVYLPSLLLMDI